MSEIGRDSAAAIREYERTLSEVAERQVIDEAEDAIARAWIAELDQVRRDGLRLVMAVRVAEHLARERLHEAELGGRPADVARAHARFAAAEAEKAGSVQHAHALLTSVDDEIEAVCQAGLERDRRGQRDLQRLRSAWAAAYGQCD